MPIERRSEPYRLYSVKELLQLEDDPQCWIVRNMIPRIGRTFVYGRGGEYKSTILFDLAVAVGSGGRLLDQYPIQTWGPVLLFSTEASIFRNRDRVFSFIRSRNIHPSSVQLHYGQQAIRLDQPEGVQLLERMIEAIRPALVILDPFRSFFRGEENSSTEVGAMTDHLDTLIEKHNISVVIIHHANKTGDLRGSSVIQGWADSVLKFVAKKQKQLPGLTKKVDVLTIFGEKQRFGSEGKVFSVVPVINEELGMTTFGIYDDEDYSGVVLAQLKHAVLEYLRKAGRPATKTELTKIFRVGNDRMRDALAWLKAGGHIMEVPLIVPSGLGRTRPVAGISLASNSSRLDMARAIVRAETAYAGSEDDDEDAPG